MFQFVVVQNGQYGVAHLENEKAVLGTYETFDEALADASGKYSMLEIIQNKQEYLRGDPSDFVNEVKGEGHANFCDHYFIEEV